MKTVIITIQWLLVSCNFYCILCNANVDIVVDSGFLRSTPKTQNPNAVMHAVTYTVQFPVSTSINMEIGSVFLGVYPMSIVTILEILHEIFSIMDFGHFTTFCCCFSCSLPAAECTLAIACQF